MRCGHLEVSRRPCQPKSNIAELLCKVPADNEWARRPFDVLSNLALLYRLERDALRPHCNAEGVVLEGTDIGIVMGSGNLL